MQSQVSFQVQNAIRQSSPAATVNASRNRKVNSRATTSSTPPYSCACSTPCSIPIRATSTIPPTKQISTHWMRVECSPRYTTSNRKNTRLPTSVMISTGLIAIAT